MQALQGSWPVGNLTQYHLEQHSGRVLPPVDAGPRRLIRWTRLRANRGWGQDLAKAGGKRTGRPLARNMWALSIQSPPASAESDQRRHLVPPCWPASARLLGRGDGRRVPARPGAGPGWPRSRSALATRRWSSKVICMRSELFRGSICWVLLFWDCFAVTKPLSQIQRSTLWPLQDAYPTPSFG